MTRTRTIYTIVEEQPDTKLRKTILYYQIFLDAKRFIDNQLIRREKGSYKIETIYQRTEK